MVNFDWDLLFQDLKLSQFLSSKDVFFLSLSCKKFKNIVYFLPQFHVKNFEFFHNWLGNQPKNYHLTSISFNYGVLDIQYLPTLLEKCIGLKFLNLDNCELRSDTLLEISSFIPVNSTITSLSLRENWLSNSKKILNFLTKFPKVEELYFNNNYLYTVEVKNLVKSLTPMYSSQLRILSLQDNYIGESGAINLVDFFQQCPKLEEIDLSWNNFADTGFFSLIKSLSYCKFLKSIDFSGNRISSLGFLSFLQYIIKSPPQHQFINVEIMNFSHNYLKDIGVEGLCDVLGNTNLFYTLKHLNLSYNRLGLSGQMSIRHECEKRQLRDNSNRPLVFVKL